MAPRLKWKRSGSQKKKRKKNDDVGGIQIQYTGRKFGRNLYSQKIPKLSPRLWLARLNSVAAELLGHDKRMVNLDVWELFGTRIVRIRKQQRGSRGDEGAN